MSKEYSERFRFDIFVDKNYATFSIMGLFGGLSLYIASIIRFKRTTDDVLGVEMASVMGLIASLTVFLLLNIQLLENLFFQKNLRGLSIREKLKVWILLYSLIAIGGSILTRLIDFHSTDTDLVILSAVFVGSTIAFYLIRRATEPYGSRFGPRAVGALAVTVVSLIVVSIPTTADILLGEHFTSLKDLLLHTAVDKQSLGETYHSIFLGIQDLKIFIFFIFVGAPLGSFLLLVYTAVTMETSASQNLYSWIDQQKKELLRIQTGKEKTAKERMEEDTVSERMTEERPTAESHVSDDISRREQEFHLDLFLDTNYSTFGIMVVFVGITVFLIKSIRLSQESVEINMVSVFGLIAALSVFLMLNFQVIESIFDEIHTKETRTWEKVKVWILIYALLTIAASILLQLYEFNSSDTNIVIVGGVITGSTVSFYLNSKASTRMNFGYLSMLVSGFLVSVMVLVLVSMEFTQRILLGKTHRDLGVTLQRTVQIDKTVVGSNSHLFFHNDINVFLFFALLGLPIGIVIYLVKQKYV
ncbi:MAG: hypothetical protein ABEK59_04590 [Halobacteria archaeon]